MSAAETELRDSSWEHCQHLHKPSSSICPVHTCAFCCSSHSEQVQGTPQVAIPPFAGSQTVTISMQWGFSQQPWLLPSFQRLTFPSCIPLQEMQKPPSTIICEARRSTSMQLIGVALCVCAQGTSREHGSADCVLPLTTILHSLRAAPPRTLLQMPSHRYFVHLLDH